MIKARLSGRNAINSGDIEESFADLNLTKVYGASNYPNWVPFGYQNLYYLDDKIINLVEMADSESVYTQNAETVFVTSWIPVKEVSQPLKNYFTTMCQMSLNEDRELRHMALKNISINTHIGPIIEWFYNFGYILLSKDITYDSLTLRALELLTVLENSIFCRGNVSEQMVIMKFYFKKV